MKRAAAVTVGTIFVLIGTFLLVTGVALLAVFGLDGRSQADAVRAVAPSSALVMDPQRADAGLPSAADLTTFTLSATAVDRSETFVGIGPADDVLVYLSGSPYDIARGVDGRSGELDQVNVAGSGQPLPPGTQSFWTQQSTGTGPQQLVVALGGPDQLVVVMRPDGSGPIDVRLTASVEAAWIGPAGLAAAAAGTALLVIGLWLLLARRRDDQRLASTSAPQGAAGTQPAAPSTSTPWGPPIAVNESPLTTSATTPESPTAAAPPAEQDTPASRVLVDLTRVPSIPPPRNAGSNAVPVATAPGVRVGTAGPDAPPREPTA